jgi:hypothetical protein
MFEEYTRTMGFIYSEPTIEVMIQIQSVYNSEENKLVDGSVEETIKSILINDKVKIKAFETLRDEEVASDEAQEDESDPSIRENLSSVTILIYNEKEMDSIIDNLVAKLANKYDIYVDSESMQIKEV